MANTAPQLEGPRLKIKRANEHIQDARKRVVEFFEAHPYDVFTDVDTVEQRESLKITLSASPPSEISIIVAEAVYQLRSSLDQLACVLAEANGAKDTSQTYFPFAGDENEFKKRGVQNKINMLHPEAISILSDLKPYRGGNNLFWALGRLANIDKHKKIIPIGSGRFGHQIKLNIYLLAGDIVQRPSSEWQPLDKERTLFTYPAGRKIYDYEVNFVTDVAFRDADFFENKPLIEVFCQFSNLTSGIVDIFESRFFT